VKRMVAVRRAEGMSDEEIAAALRDGAASLVPGASRWVLDLALPDQALLRAKNPKVPEGPPRFDGVVWGWDVDEATVPPVPAWVSVVAAYDVEEHPGFDLGAVIGEPAIKQISWVAQRDDISVDEFRKHYREHIDITRDHHGVARYQQNDVARVLGDAPHADGFSELWFRDADEFTNRFYLHDDSVAVVREDTTEFIDFRRTSSIVLTPYG
jgi:hypothetical protein